MGKRAGFILLLVVCALGVGASHARADGTPPPTTVIADGVQIGSVLVGGMTSDQAMTAVQDAYFAPVVVHVGHRNYPVSPHHFHTSLDLATALQTALTAPADTAVSLTPTVDSALIEKWVKNLAAKTDRPAVAGNLFLRNSRPFFTRARPGRALRPFPTRMLIRSSILRGVRATIVAPQRTLTAAATKAEPVIVIHRGSNRLYLYDGIHLVRTFPVATGQAIYPTPLGHFQIVVKWVNPWWYPPTQDAWAKGLKPVPPGPGNPLGTRWMGLSAPGVGIHGTDEPWSIGHSESHGCIRMQVPDAEWLFTHVLIGTPVFIIAS
ncbi:MAG TPA: L,D-transpeptidase family protein [Gaiellaceae bacterium]|nr:L,D-transpeptidase family protein [Gaiellaceae bacterium]